jgi:hypothetical protein
MTYLSVTEKGKEILHPSRPTRKTRYDKILNLDNRWYDYYNPFYGIELPKGTIKHLIGRELTFDDKPISLSRNKVY